LCPKSFLAFLICKGYLSENDIHSDITNEDSSRKIQVHEVLDILRGKPNAMELLKIGVMGTFQEHIWGKDRVQQ